MSLHLIESRKMPSAAARKPAGAMASLFVHGMFVTAVFALANTTPVKHLRMEQHIPVVFQKPIEQPLVNRSPSQSNSGTPSSQTAAPSDANRPMPTITVDIPTEIPPITASNGDVTPTEFGRNRSTGSSPNGLPGGGALGSGGGVLNELQVDRPVVALAGMRSPRYPEALRAAGIEGSVLATFVVDTLGRVESASLEISNGAHAQFSTAVRESLTNAKFRPAEFGGRLVRQRVAMPFVFSLTR